MKRTLQRTLLKKDYPQLPKDLPKGKVICLAAEGKENSHVHLTPSSAYFFDIPTDAITIDKRKQGRRNKAAGARWELTVREAMLNLGWHVAKFTNNVDLEADQMVAAKHKFNFFTKVMSLGTGFPDFIAWDIDPMIGNDIVGVECKSGGTLDAEEKKKCQWLLERRIFSKIFIAKKKKEGRQIIPEFVDFNEVSN